MPIPFAAISAGIGLASAIGGMLSSNSAQEDAEAATAAANRAAARAAKYSKKIEKQRELQMELEGQRRIRQEIRQAMVARSIALTNATNQGAGDSSGLQGGMAQVAAESTSNILGIQQNLTIGREIFRLNRKLTDANTEYNRFSSQASLAQSDPTGSNLFNFGVSMIGNANTIGNVGASLFN